MSYSEVLLVDNSIKKQTMIAPIIFKFNDKKQLIGTGDNKELTKPISLPHPCSIQLSAKESDDIVIYKQLIDLHLRGILKTGDFITGYKNNSLNNVYYFSKIFSGEFELQQKVTSDKQIIITLTKIQPTINANIHHSIPNSSQALEAELSKNGHILISTNSSIKETIIEDLLIGNSKLMEYNRYGTTVRKKVNNSKTVEVSPWPKELLLPAHSEMTHHTHFPKKIAFFCMELAEYGGETTMYDCAKAFKLLSSTMQKKVLKHKVICYKRYVADSSSLQYISWKQLMGENTTLEMAKEHFLKIGYQCHVLHEEKNGELVEILEVALVRPMTYYYQNNICLHTSMVPLTPFWYSQLWPNKIPPLRATWDDGNPLTYEEFYELDEAILLSRIRYNGWQKHDVLILDNLRVAHGRLPYIGKRVTTALMAQAAQFMQDSEYWKVVL